MTTSYTLTGDFNDLLVEEPRITGAWLETNLPAGTALVDLDANKVLLAGPKRITLDANNTFSISAIATNSTGTNVTDGTLRYRVRAQYSDGTGVPRTWESGWFDLTAAADLSDKAGGAGDLDVTIAPSASLIDSAQASNITTVGTATNTALTEGFASGQSTGVARFIMRARAGESLKIAALGDSILEGTTGTTPGVDDATTLVRNELDTRFAAATFTAANRAVSGYTIATSAINGKMDQLYADKPDLIIVGFGRNDVVADAVAVPRQGYPIELAARGWEVFIREVRRRLPQADILILSGVPGTMGDPDTTMKAYQLRVRQIAAAYGCEWVDTYAAFVALGDYSAYKHDAVHPNALGHEGKGGDG